MEYASGGELYEYINSRGNRNETTGQQNNQTGVQQGSQPADSGGDGLPDHEARKFFRQIVSAVYYLHQVRNQLLTHIYIALHVHIKNTQ